MSDVGNASGLRRFATPIFGPAGLIFAPFLVVAAISLVYGGKLAVDQQIFLRGAAHAKGVVVGLERAPASRGTPNYHPIVRYDAPGGESVEFRSHYPYPKGTYELQQVVDVLYDPADPRKAEVDSAQSRYRVFLLPAFGVGLGVMCLAGYTVLYWIYRLVVRKAAAERA
jgi:hypothetical protein